MGMYRKVLGSLLACLAAAVINGLEVATRGYRRSLKELYSEEGGTGVDDFVADNTGAKPAFLQPSSVEHISIVNFYKDQCKPCESFKEHFINLADQLHHITEEGHVKTPKRTLTFHAIHCTKHPKLCSDEKVVNFPSVRAYSQNKPLEFNTSKLHPYDVLHKLHFDIDSLVEDKLDNDKLPFDLGKRRKETADRIQAALGWILKNELYRGDATSLPEAMRGLLRLWLTQLNQTLPKLKPFTSDLLQRYKYIAKSKAYLDSILAEHNVNNSPLNCEAVYDLFQSVLVGSMEYNYLGYDGQEKLHPALVAHTNYQFMKQYVDICDLRERFGRNYEACRDDEQCPYYSALHIPDDLNAEPLEKDWTSLSIWWARVVRPQPFPSKEACPTCAKDSTALLRYLRLEFGAFHSTIENLTPISKRQGFAVHHASLFLLVFIGLAVRSGRRFGPAKKKTRRRYTLTVSLPVESSHSKGE